MKICFICHANICRSFISQEILKSLLRKDNRTDIEVISRGTYVLDYLTVPKKIQDFLTENNIKYKTHMPKLYAKEDIVSSDFIFVMTKDQYEEIIDKYSEYSDKIHILEQYISNKTRDIEDPISLEGKKFIQAAENIKELTITAYKKILSTN